MKKIVFDCRHILKASIFLLAFLFPLLAPAQPEKKDVGAIEKGKRPASQYFKDSGNINYAGVDLLPGGKTTSIRFRIASGYQFTPKFSAGLGIGFTFYDDPLSLVPLFIDIKYRLLEANTTPFAFFKGGYSFSILTDKNIQIDKHQGGFMLNPGIGLQSEAKSNIGWYLNAGYNLDYSSFEQERWNNRIVETDISYRRLMFGFGLLF